MCYPHFSPPKLTSGVWTGVAWITDLWGLYLLWDTSHCDFTLGSVHSELAWAAGGSAHVNSFFPSRSKAWRKLGTQLLSLWRDLFSERFEQFLSFSNRCMVFYYYHSTIIFYCYGLSFFIFTSIINGTFWWAYYDISCMCIIYLIIFNTLLSYFTPFPPTVLFPLALSLPSIFIYYLYFFLFFFTRVHV